MNWLLQIHATHAVAHAIGILALVCLVGIALGSVKVRGIGLGTAGVLFAGILTGYFSNPVDHATLEFVKEFGLVLFIFTIGLQLGPGFLAALRQQGLGLNALAATVVALGALTASTPFVSLALPCSWRPWGSLPERSSSPPSLAL
jgi:Predicted permease